MRDLINRNTGIAAFAAVVIVGLTGLTLDRGHDGALPTGVIEVGTLETLAVGDLVDRAAARGASDRHARSAARRCDGPCRTAGLRRSRPWAVTNRLRTSS